LIAQTHGGAVASSLARGRASNPSAALAPGAAEARGLLDKVAAFVLENQLDEAVERALREEPVYLQRMVMDKYVTGQNKSAVVMRRIRDCKASAPDAVAVFAAEHDLDDNVEQALRALPEHLQEQVTQKYVTGRNKSAVVMKRIRDLASPEALLAPTRPDPVAAFVQENELDAQVEQALRAQPTHVQEAVMEKYVTGGNKSAVVMRRIRDVSAGMR